MKSPAEYQRSRPLKVGLASGETDTLRINKGGTLVTLNRDTQPILPLGVAIRVLGMSVLWREDRCDVIHPKRGRIRATLEKGCPEVPRALCLSLIDELEACMEDSKGRTNELQAITGTLGSSLDEMLEKALSAPDYRIALSLWTRHAYSEVPERLLERCLPALEVDWETSSGFNRHTRRKVERGHTLLHLFSGSQTWSHGSYAYTLNLEKDRGWDLLDDGIYGYLISAVLKGHVSAIVAGPPCRTWSRLRRLEDHGLPPLRARNGCERFGYQGVEAQHQQLVDGDAVLLLRTLILMELMQAVKRTRCEAPGFVFLEHPADPATYAECRNVSKGLGTVEARELLHQPPSIWAWTEIQQCAHCMWLASTKGPWGIQLLNLLKWPPALGVFGRL